MMECLYLLLFVFHFTAGCALSGDQMEKEVRGHTGDSVLLSCSCIVQQTKPNTFKWEFRSEKSGTSEYEEIYSSQTGQHRDRVRLTNENSGNLSLLISDLTEEDQGDYSCSVRSDFKLIRLHVEVRETPTHPTKTSSASPPEPPTTNQQTAFSLQLVIHILMVLLLLLFGGVAIIYSRWRGRRSGQNCDHCRTSRS